MLIKNKKEQIKLKGPFECNQEFSTPKDKKSISCLKRRR